MRVTLYTDLAGLTKLTEGKSAVGVVTREEKFNVEINISVNDVEANGAFIIINVKNDNNL